MKPKVVIVGAGFSGVSAAIRLHAYAHLPLTVYLIDSPIHYGRGVAYSGQDLHLVMNGMAGRLSAFEETPDDFVDWLRKTTRKSQTELKCLYAPRKLYGDYLRQILREYASPSPHGASIQTMYDQVTDIRPRSGKYRVTLASGLEMLADGIVLAHGNSIPRRVCQDQWVECIEDPWNVAAVHDIPNDAKVLIVGTGQTMIDIALLLKHKYHQGQIYAISRRGLIAHPHADRETGYHLNLEQLPRDLNSLVRYMRKTARDWTTSGGDWRAVLNALRPHTQELWMALSLKEKRRFLEHVEPYWRTHRTRISPKVWIAIQGLLSSGQLQCFPGRIQSIERRHGCLCIKVRPRGETRTMILEVDRLVNCSGPNHNYRHSENPLVTRLIESGVIACHPSDVGMNVAPNGAIISSSGQISKTMFAVGPPCKGTLFEITVIREIRRQAAEVAAELTRALHDGRARAPSVVGNTQANLL